MTPSPLGTANLTPDALKRIDDHTKTMQDLSEELESTMADATTIIETMEYMEIDLRQYIMDLKHLVRQIGGDVH